jgi:hypothetical protein
MLAAAASVVDQVNVDVPPAAMVAGEAEIVAVGGAGGTGTGGATGGVAIWVTLLG